jgi:hypothetical protein
MIMIFLFWCSSVHHMDTVCQQSQWREESIVKTVGEAPDISTLCSACLNLPSGLIS